MKVLIGAATYSVVAASMSQIIKVNFSNFYQCNVGPVYDFVNTLKESYGYLIGQTIYVVPLLILHIAFFYGAYKLYTLIEKCGSIK